MSESIAQKTITTSFWLALSKFFNMGISFVITMLLARLLTPSDYGAVALLGVFFAIAGSVSECGFRNALIRKENCSQADYSTAFFYNVSVSVLLYVVLYLCAPLVADFYDMPILTPVMRVSGISLIIGAVNITQSVQLTRKLDFKRPALISSATGILSGIAGVIAAFYGMGVWALVVQGLVSALLGSLTLIYIVRWKPTLEISRDSFRYLWGFGSKMLLTGIISTIYANIYSIVIGKFYNPNALGLYNRGDRSAHLVPDIICGIFTANTLPILSQLRSDHERMISVYRKYVILTSFLNIPFCLILAALAKPYIYFFLTEKWSGAIIFIQIFCMTTIFSPAAVLNMNIFQVEGRSDITLKLEIVKKVVGFAVVFLLARYSPLVLAIGSSVFSLSACALNLYYVNKIEKIPQMQQITDLMPCLVSGALAAIASFAITLLPLSPFFQLLIGGSVGLAVYIFMTKRIFKMEVYDQILTLIKNRINSKKK